MTARIEPVGAVEVLEQFGVSRQTFDKWRARGRAGVRFPEPRWTVGGRPAWNFDDVARWWRATGGGLA